MRGERGFHSVVVVTIGLLSAMPCKKDSVFYFFLTHMTDWIETRGRKGGTVWINRKTGRMTSVRPKESQKDLRRNAELIGKEISWI